MNGSAWDLPASQNISLGAEISALIFKENNTIAFDLSTFTAKINK
jgi:hypothetical protein